MTTTELQVLERYLDAPFGSAEAMDALAEVTEMVDLRRQQVNGRRAESELWRAVKDARENAQ